MSLSMGKASERELRDWEFKINLIKLTCNGLNSSERAREGENSNMFDVYIKYILMKFEFGGWAGAYQFMKACYTYN